MLIWSQLSSLLGPHSLDVHPRTSVVRKPFRKIQFFGLACKRKKKINEGDDSSVEDVDWDEENWDEGDWCKNEMHKISDEERWEGLRH